MTRPPPVMVQQGTVHGATRNPFATDHRQFLTCLTPEQVQQRLDAELISGIADYWLPPFLRDWLSGESKPTVCGSVNARGFAIRTCRSFESTPVLRAVGIFSGTSQGSQVGLRLSINWRFAVSDLCLLTPLAVGALTLASTRPGAFPLAAIGVVLVTLFVIGRYLSWRWFADDEVEILTRFVRETLGAIELSSSEG